MVELLKKGKLMLKKISEIEQNVTLLEFDKNKKLYLIGTAHVSVSSVELVEKVINDYSPDTICVELDEQRYKNIMKPQSWAELDIIEIIKKKQLFFFIGQFIMSSFQKKISEQTGSKPGEEFKKAIEIAEATDKKLVLADRNVGTTLKRAWRLTPFRQKLKLFGSLLFGSKDELDDINIEDMKTKDAIDSLVKTFGDELPKTKEVLIDERDMYLSKEIMDNLGDVTVAAVGAGHVPGMLLQFENGTIDDQKKHEINIIPAPSRFGKLLPWLIPLAVVGVITFGFLSGNKDIAKEAIIYWVLANGILTAIGCLLALSHPLTIVVGFIAAPITSLNPTIGAGIVTAFAQTILVRPRVKDFDQIKNKTLKIKQWWSNRLTKIFLVFILSSIGSSIGTFVALPVLIKMFK